VFSIQVEFFLKMLCRKATNLFVIPAPAFAGVNLSPQKRGAGIQKQKNKAGFPLARERQTTNKPFLQSILKIEAACGGPQPAA
jgi:hypothetical protein